MKKVSSIFVAVGLVLVFSSVSQATVVFGFDQTDLIGLTEYGEVPGGQSLSYVAVNLDAIYGSMLGDVGFMGTLLDLTIPISPEIMIGSGSEDLTGYDAFAMTLSNDNDDVWTVELYIDNGVSIMYSNVATLSPGQSENLILNFANLGAVDSIGFVISADRNDTFHVSANVIPEPATICLLGLGGLLLRKRKNV